MATLESKYYSRAEALYVREGLTLAEIREALGDEVSIASLSRWSKKGDWPGLKDRWAKVNADMPNMLLDATYERLTHLKSSPSDTKGDELWKIKGLIEALRLELAGKEEAGGGADHIKMALEILYALVADLKELAPSVIQAINDNYDELMSRTRRRYA